MEEQKNKMEEWIACSIQQAGREKDEQDIATLKSFMGKQKAASHIRTMWSAIISVAAVFALIFSLNVYFDNRAMDKAFASYYTPLEYDSELFSRGSETTFLEIENAMKAYENKDYHLALKEFNSIENIDNNLLIYKAICLMETDQPSSAIELLEKLVSFGEGTEYYQQANWFLALGYLRNHEENKAIKLLKDISSSINPYSDKAKELINELK